MGWHYRRKFRCCARCPPRVSTGTGTVIYCPQCGETIVREIPADDNRERDVCSACGSIFYSNPKVVCGCILEWRRDVLLCKRAINPRYGLWTLPAGFMENNETSAEGAAREAVEEANAHCDDLRLFALYNLPQISQVYIIYHGTLRNGEATAGAESLEVGLYKENEIPWDELAFPVVNESLKRYFEDRKKAAMQIHITDIHRRQGGEIEIVRR